MPRILASAPVLLVKDVVHSANWYRDKLGFIITGLYGEPPNFAILHRDEHYIMFSHAPAKDIKPNWKIVDKTWNVYFWVQDVETLYRQFIDSGATIDYTLHTKPYG